MINKCLLTGATGGIGKAIAHLLAKQGYHLILQARSEERLYDLQQALGGNHQIVIGDLTNNNDRRYIVEQAVKNGPVNLLINNAGISHFGDFIDTKQCDIDKLVALNLTAPMLLTNEMLPHLLHQKSIVVNVGSALGAIGFPCFSSYCATKFGLRGFSESLARELRNTKVRICYLSPRTTTTSINSGQVIAMNQAIGNAIDSPEYVAQQLLNLITSRSTRLSIGWPEKFFTRLNGLLPEVVDKALLKKLPTIQKFSLFHSK